MAPLAGCFREEEPNMNSLRVLGAAAALALMLPLAVPTASFAQGRFHGGGGGGAHFAGGGGGGMRMGGGAAVRGGGGNFAAAARPGLASPGLARPGLARPGVAAPAFSGSRSFAAATPPANWQGGGGNWHGGSWRHRGGGFWPGVAAGAAIGALGSSYAYYGGPYYDDPYYYDDSYYDDGAAVAVVPDGGGDSVAYCQQRFRSYDPATGTYLGYDGLRHPCP
jgi:hypothetical protein